MPDRNARSHAPRGLARCGGVRPLPRGRAPLELLVVARPLELGGAVLHGPWCLCEPLGVAGPHGVTQAPPAPPTEPAAVEARAAVPPPPAVDLPPEVLERSEGYRRWQRAGECVAVLGFDASARVWIRSAATATAADVRLGVVQRGATRVYRRFVRALHPDHGRHVDPDLLAALGQARRWLAGLRVCRGPR